MDIIEINNLTKNFGNFQALKGVNLAVKEGEVHGFIGPNGAGKSTTIRILLGLLRKSSGSIYVMNEDPWENAVNLHTKLAYVPGDVSLWPDLTGGEIIDFLGRLHGGLDLNKKKELIDSFQLDPTKKSSTYSKGNRQKVALIAAFSCNSELYLFDEPTSGLDPLMEVIFQEYVGKLKEKGKTVLLSSHILSEVESLCDRVSIISNGKIVETGSLNQMKHLTRTIVNVTTNDALEGLSKIPGVHDIVHNKNQYRFSIDTDVINTVISALSRINVTSFTAEPPSLEELFMRHYEVKE
ncbi:ABC transporter ATP-binding protein [Tissierella sp. Yu-01]|uniref:ABC transporter ATP-binding protein n=1 Tax=Tissierella sp. Yu-01 TaxID=3035694 RepID=UPI00240E2BFD|nr:ABC transporter ATP-binding protein [Tissierella sp. Yu-01]WFA09261.1 ABC transporter ATP-binding protein [Tissierella sp. Yu-01]